MLKPAAFLCLAIPVRQLPLRGFHPITLRWRQNYGLDLNFLLRIRLVDFQGQVHDLTFLLLGPDCPKKGGDG